MLHHQFEIDIDLIYHIYLGVLETRPARKLVARKRGNNCRHEYIDQQMSVF